MYQLEGSLKVQTQMEQKSLQPLLVSTSFVRRNSSAFLKSFETSVSTEFYFMQFKTLP